MFFERFQQLMPGRPLILGHRGSPNHARENSLESFRAALETGADGIELDVQCTGDGVLVAHHDECLPSGENLADYPYKILKRKTLEAGYELPQLSEIFTLISGKGLLNIELKADGYEDKVLLLAKQMLPPESYAISSFNAVAICMCRKFAPEVPALLIVWGPRKPDLDLERMTALSASGIAFENPHITEEQAAFFRDRRYPIFVWTVNEADEAKRFASWGVTGLITDSPAELVTAFNSAKGETNA